MSLAQRISEALVLLFGGGVQLSNRNGFVDGAFANWQVGAANPATLATSGTYVGPVMWRVSAGAGGAGTVALLDIRNTADMAAMEGEDTINSIKVVVTTGSTGTVAARTAAGVWQNIENVGRYAGKSVTLSFKLKADAPLTIPGVLCSQVFGSGGSPSAAVVADKAVAWVVGTTFKKFSVRIDVPSIAGKTLGTSFGTDYGTFGFWLPPGVTTTGLYVAEAQIEACSPGASNDLNGGGGSPTSFEHRGMQAELARVQRFYRAIQASGASFTGGATGSTDTFAFGPTLNPSMRAVPAASLIGTWTCTAPGGNSGTVSVIGVTQDMWYLHGSSGTYTSGQTCYFGSSAGSAVILDARL